MKKLFKNRLFVICLVIVLTIAVLVVSILSVNGTFSKTAPVYKVSEMALDWWGAGTTAQGKVASNAVHSITLDAEDKVAKVYVKKNQKVKKGDKLFEYDLSGVKAQIKSKQIALESAQNALYIAGAQLKSMQNATPGVGSSTDVNDATLNTVVSTDMIPYAGDGTQKNPYRYNLSGGAVLGSDYISAMCEKRDEDLYELLEYHSADNINGTLLYEIRLVFYTDATFDFSVSQFDIGQNIMETDYSKYTRDELDDMIANKKSEIKSLEVDARMAQNELSAAKNKQVNSTVYAGVSGVVKTLRSPENAKKQAQPFIEVVGSSGMYVSGLLNEFELGEVKEGSQVDILSAGGDVLAKATITDISEYPSAESEADNETAFSVANKNASYYPFTAAIEKTNKVKIGDSVSVSFDKANSTSVYILNAFVRSDSRGESYVYAQGENGTLSKLKVSTGTVVYGEYIEITSGISKDTYLAFPYGKSAKEGARTQRQPFTDFLNEAV